MSVDVVLQSVLGVLAAYHLGMGAVSVSAPRVAARVGGMLYALEAAESAQLRYGVRMLGLYALALGVLLVNAAAEPRAHVDVVVVAAALQLGRAVARIVLRDELAKAFRIPFRRNLANAAVLVGESAVLLVCLVVAS